MNSLVQGKEKFNFSYSSFEPTDNAELFINLANEYNTANPPQRSTIEQHLDLLCEIDNENYMLLDDIRSHISNKFLLTYLEPILKEAEVSGIKSLIHFRVWIQGNHKKLNYPCSHLDAHTHLDEDLQGTFTNDPIHTHTVIIPLYINNSITESFWANWITDVPQTVTPKLKILNSMGIDKVSTEIVTSALGEWWNSLKELASNNEVIIKFPNLGEKLTLDFNSRNYLHGINNIGNNLYLIILFDRCKK
jgi:hypothetical protein